jgi:hypothetical protein
LQISPIVDSAKNEPDTNITDKRRRHK